LALGVSLGLRLLFRPGLLGLGLLILWLLGLWLLGLGPLRLWPLGLGLLTLRLLALLSLGLLSLGLLRLRLRRRARRGRPERLGSGADPVGELLDPAAHQRHRRPPSLLGEFLQLGRRVERRGAATADRRPQAARGDQAHSGQQPACLAATAEQITTGEAQRHPSPVAHRYPPPSPARRWPARSTTTTRLGTE